jgi:catechol 2,3-dioxygenase-like lactoylglutathione lyase family enzyme
MRVLAGLALALCVAAPAQAALAPPNAAGVTFGHLHLNVTSIEAQSRFWADYFGGVPFKHGKQAGVRFPDGFLILFTQVAPTGSSQGTSLDHFGFKVADLQAFLAKWKGSGRTVQNEINGMEGTPASNMLGLDGLRIEVQEDRSVTAPTANHMHFQTDDNAALRDWYVATFGLEATTRGRLATAANIPGMNLSFSATRTPVGPTKGRAIDHIGFEVKNLDTEMKALAAKGVTPETPIHDEVGYKSAFIVDPQGVRVELTQGLAGY